MSAPIQCVKMMIKIQVNLSLPYDGSFVAHSMIMRIQKTVPASAKATNVKKNSDPIIGHSAWTKDYKPEGSRSCAQGSRATGLNREISTISGFGSNFTSAPNIKISGFEPTGNTPPEGRNDITGHIEALNWTIGKHQMRFGREYRQMN
jgi:hypothetical protein